MGYVGTYDRTIFYNPSNKYCIISVKTSDQSVPQQARSAYHHRDNMIRFIAVGYELPQTDKVSMILDGEWENGKHGVQLQVDKCEEIVPQTKEGVCCIVRKRRVIQGGSHALPSFSEMFCRRITVAGVSPHPM